MRCWPPGKASPASRDAPRCAPGSIGLPPTGASTPVGQPAGAQPRSGTYLMSNRPSRPGSVKWCGSSRTPTPSEGPVNGPLGPEARYEQNESISLAFVTALQVLPPRQVAALVFRDVLGFHANEVAEMLGSTVESVNSALKRARASLERRWAPGLEVEPARSPARPPRMPWRRSSSAPGSAPISMRSVALLTDDVFASMPPMPFEYVGRDLVARFCAIIFNAGRRFDLVPTRANAQPAFGAYLRSPEGISHGTGLYVLTLRGGRICAMTRFENTVLPSFGLPRSLPSRQPTFEE